MMRRVALGLALILFPTVAWAQVRVTSLSPHLILLQSPRSNMVASVGDEGAVIVGEMDTLSAAEVADSIGARSASPRRFVIAIAGLASIGQADAGWDKRGALVVMQELAARRIVPPKSSTLRRPRGEFSHFFSIDLNGESIHAVNQEPGYARSDVLVHFENTNVIYLGESFPGDGYPRIDSARGGTVEGLIKTLDAWADQEGPRMNRRFVGARGPVATSADVTAFRNMVAAVWKEVRRSKAAGQTVDQVIAARPTAAYDAQWGHGLIGANQFLRDLYRESR